MATPDLSTLAGLLAVAQDPEAAAQAREFLLQQKLMAEQEGARLRLQQAAQAHEARIEEGRLKQARTEEAGRSARSQAQLEPETHVGRLNRAIEMKKMEQAADLSREEQARLSREHSEDMALKRAALVQYAVDKALSTYAQTTKARRERGESPLVAKDFIAALPGGLAMLLPEVPEGAPYEERVRAARTAYVNALGVTGEGGAPGMDEGAAGAQFDELERIVKISLAGLPPEAAEPALQAIQAALDDPEAVLDAGGALSPEQESQFIGKSAARLVTAALEGTGLTPLEQMRFASYWNQQDEPALKAGLLDKTLDYAVASMKVANQWTDEQALEFRGSLQGAIAAAVDNGSEAVLKDIVRPGIPLKPKRTLLAPRKLQEGEFKGLSRRLFKTQEESEEFYKKHPGAVERQRKLQPRSE